VSRGDGFDRMDVSTSIDDDPKFRALARRHPDLLAVAGWAYVGLLARSWREGCRLTLEEGWPALLPFDPAGAAALVEVGLVDADTRIPPGPWSSWFSSASERRQQGRDRQRRADVKRGHTRQTDSQDRQSGSQAGPTLAPAQRQRWPDVGPVKQEPTTTRDLRDLTTCPQCGDGPLSDRDPDVATDRGGQRWHRACPGSEMIDALDTQGPSPLVRGAA
jgi:hypothetical protein